LGLDRVKLTVLGVVSKNDYNSNIPLLGSETNFGIIKSLNATDPTTMVQEYLAHGQVVRKNKVAEEFGNSLKVFVRCEQTPMQSEPSTPDSAQVPAIYRNLHDTFSRLREQFNMDRKEHWEELREAKK
ncbi:hypothetical protein BGX20_007698, partial [Mortierella sp. AD010]